jgi:hypothetical protein
MRWRPSRPTTRIKLSDSALTISIFALFVFSSPHPPLLILLDLCGNRKGWWLQEVYDSR